MAPERLCTKIGGADGIRGVDDRCPTRVVPLHGECQAKCKDERHKSKQRGLEDAEGLTQCVDVSAQAVPKGDPEERRAEHDSEDEQPELEAAQPEKHDKLELAAAKAGPTCHS